MRNVLYLSQCGNNTKSTLVLLMTAILTISLFSTEVFARAAKTENRNSDTPISMFTEVLNEGEIIPTDELFYQEQDVELELTSKHNTSTRIIFFSDIGTDVIGGELYAEGDYPAVIIRTLDNRYLINGAANEDNPFVQGTGAMLKLINSKFSFDDSFPDSIDDTTITIHGYIEGVRNIENAATLSIVDETTAYLQINVTANIESGIEGYPESKAANYTELIIPIYSRLTYPGEVKVEITPIDSHITASTYPYSIYFDKTIQVYLYGEPIISENRNDIHIGFVIEEIIKNKLDESGIISLKAPTGYSWADITNGENSVIVQGGANFKRDITVLVNLDDNDKSQLTIKLPGDLNIEEGKGRLYINNLKLNSPKKIVNGDRINVTISGANIVETIVPLFQGGINEPLTRGDLGKLIVERNLPSKILDEEMKSIKDEHSFSDIEDYVHSDYIQISKKLGLMDGDEYGKFNPYDVLSVEEFIYYLMEPYMDIINKDDLNLYELKGISEDHFAYKHIKAAAMMGLIPKLVYTWSGDEYFEPDETILHEDALEIYAECQRIFLTHYESIGGFVTIGNKVCENATVKLIKVEGTNSTKLQETKTNKLGQFWFMSVEDGDNYKIEITKDIGTDKYTGTKTNLKMPPNNNQMLNTIVELSKQSTTTPDRNNSGGSSSSPPPKIEEEETEEEMEEETEEIEGGTEELQEENANLEEFLQPATTSSLTTFDDLEAAAWAIDSILFLYNKGIIAGMSDNRFAPNDNATREQFVKMLVDTFGLLDENAESPFTDTQTGEWYYPYVASAFNNEIIAGKSNNIFGIGENITRQDIATMIYRAIQKLGIELPEINEKLEFTDENHISEYAKYAVELLQKAGVISGVPDGSFKPKQNATRAQVAKMLHILLELC